MQSRAISCNLEQSRAISSRASHHLAHAREEHVHRADRRVVVVEAHVEGLAPLRVVVHDDGLLVDHLSEVLFVLRLQLLAPLRRELPRHAVLRPRHLWARWGEARLEIARDCTRLHEIARDCTRLHLLDDLDRLRVRDAREGVFHHHLPAGRRELEGSWRT